MISGDEVYDVGVVMCKCIDHVEQNSSVIFVSVMVLCELLCYHTEIEGNRQIPMSFCFISRYFYNGKNNRDILG